MTVIEKGPMQHMAGKDSALRDWVRALEATGPIIRSPERLLLDTVEEVAVSHGSAPALLSTQERLSYRQLADRANRYGRWALAQDIAKGETVALLMPNRPEYMAIWLGITAVGGIVALLNTNLRGQALAHCVDIVAPKHLIVAAELLKQCQLAVGYLFARPKIWAHGADDNIEFPSIDRDVERYSPHRLSLHERRDVTIADRALAIYTSGTTGLPKAANASHHRLLQWSLWFAGLINTSPKDRMYNCLPMYHSVGGVVATGALLVNGGSVVIRDKFSVQNFWDDVCEWDCTLFQYIGELCRYLVNAPEHPRERAHRLRLCCGNGLRADVWEQFQRRFRIPRVLEYYAATEGNFSLYNVEGKVGAIGRLPSFLTHRFPLALVQFDHVAGQPARDDEGLCIRCKTDEPGEAIGRIGDGAGGTFEGYTSEKESERKILRNVFEKGDSWYRTGDLMRKDSAGFFYFVDRIGDTFRWKGENVATSEVGAAMMEFPGITEATVYGVAVPGTEGAAGMAAIVANRALDFAQLREHLAGRLPAYARPLFLRVRDKIDATATFKHSKHDLQCEGYDPAATPDPIYFAAPEGQTFVQLDAALYARIAAGVVRL
ncbi:MAG TPA: long-chain-acyl-CoA synthetase [Xanthobacteraceae bacterium]|nr:long-chain-acyl-CoA synthetase [Xanthobacteraceae bacterium]